MNLISGPIGPKSVSGGPETPIPKEITEAFLLFSRVREGLFKDADGMITFFLQMDRISKMVEKIPDEEVARLGEAGNKMATSSDYLLGMLLTAGPLSIMWGGLAGLIAKYIGSRHGLEIGFVTGGAVAAFLSLVYRTVASKSLSSGFDAEPLVGAEKEGEKIIANILSKWVEVSRILDENNIESSNLNRVVLDFAKNNRDQYKLGFPFDIKD